jgi:hypothetical protein
MTSITDRPGCLGSILAFFRGHPREEDVASAAPMPYRTRDDFLSPAEQSLYRLMNSALQGRAVVFPKVRLADVFFIARPNENMSYINRVAQRHLDFLLCDPATLRPVAGLELDDSSHARPQRQASDMFLNEAFSAAGLPLIRVPVQASYTAEQLSSILSAIVPAAAPAKPTQQASADAAPLCPKCGVPMVVRQVAQGPHKGKRFYGCRNFPQCRQLIAIDR